MADDFIKRDLIDGFQQVFTFQGHKLHVRGFAVVEWSNDRAIISDDGSATGDANTKRRHSKEIYLSWDTKQLFIWERKLRENIPRVVKFVKFHQPNFICSATPVSKPKFKIQVILAAALDMSFKVYDRNLNLIESIKHEERAIMQLVFDGTRDIILSSGAGGIALWKFYKNKISDSNHIMEKLLTFESCNYWVTKMIYEPNFERIYVMNDRTVKVYNITRQTLQAEIVNAHYAPVTAACWFARNQFYITGCSRGEIKCWTANYNKKSSRETGLPSFSSSNKFALLHTFTGHTDAVTCIILHKVPGLAISCSLDASIKILNLEYLVELYSVYLGHGVLDMRVINIVGAEHGCLFTMTDGSIKLWQITSYTEKFGVLTSPVTKIETIENIQLKSIATPHVRIDTPSASNILYPSMVVQYSESVDPTERVLMTRSAQDVVVYDEGGALMSRLEADQVVVNGVVHCALSVYQKRLFCLCDNDTVRVYSLRSLPSSLEKSFTVRSKSDINLSDEQALSACLSLINIRPESDMMLARASTVDSSQGMGLPRANSGQGPDRLLGAGKEEYLLVGMRNGSILFIDCLRNCELLFNFKAFSGIITDLKFRRTQSELVVVGRNVAETSVSVKVLHLPDLSCKCESHDLKNISCYDVAECSHDFAFGCMDGNVRLFTSSSVLLSSQIRTVTADAEPCQELSYSRLHHDVEILSISFSYEVGVYATCARDSFVKIWECKKGLLRSIRLNQICHSIAFASNVTYVLPSSDSISKKSNRIISSAGDIRISQGNYILKIPKRLWDDRQIQFDMPKSYDQVEAIKSASTSEVEASIMITTAASFSGEEKNSISVNAPTIALGTTKSIQISQEFEKRGDDEDSHKMAVSIRRASKVEGGKGDKSSKRNRQFTRAHLVSQLRSRLADPLPTHQDGDSDADSQDVSPIHAAADPAVAESDIPPTSLDILSDDNAVKRQVNFTIQDAFNFVTIRIPSTPKEMSTKTSAINVRRPRFLIRKKPPIRPVSMELALESGTPSVPANEDAIQQENNEKFSQQELGKGTYNSQNGQILAGNANDLKFQVSQSSSSTVPTSIRSTAIGLSPRARLTLLSFPAATTTGSLDGVDTIKNESNNVVDNGGTAANGNAVVDKMILESSKMTVSDTYKLHREYLRVGKERAYQQSFRTAVGSHLRKTGIPDSITEDQAIPRTPLKRRGNLQMKVMSPGTYDNSPEKVELAATKEVFLAAGSSSPKSLLETRKSALSKSSISPRKKTVNFSLNDTS